MRLQIAPKLQDANKFEQFFKVAQSVINDSVIGVAILSSKNNRETTALLQKHMSDSITVNCCEYKSYSPNAFTFPFAPITSKRVISGLATLPGNLSAFSIIPRACMIFETMSTLVRKPSNPIIEVRNNKICIDNVYNDYTIYYASGLKEILTEDEFLAILLHEIGHHGQTTNVIQAQVIKFLRVICLTIFAKTTRAPFSKDVPVDIYSVRQIIIIVLSVLIILNLYIGRKMEYTSDWLSAKLGTTESTISALTKIDTFMRNKMPIVKNPGIFLNMFRILLHISWIIDQHFARKGLTVHPSIDQRKNNIQTGKVAYTGELRVNQPLIAGCDISLDAAFVEKLSERKLTQISKDTLNKLYLKFDSIATGLLRYLCK